MTNQIAKTIYQQLGGRVFAVMTGARDFLAGDQELQFSLPGKPGYVRNGINKVRIELLPSDTYKVEFFRIAKRGLKVKTVVEFNDVYFDQLVPIFEKETGLVARMPKVIMNGR